MEDFQNILVKFIRRLVDRGHTLDRLTPLLMQAASAIDTQLLRPPSSGSSSNDNVSTLYLHWTYHPNGIQRQDLRRLYNSTLKDHIPYNRMQVAMSRPKNLLDILTRATLKLPPGLDLKQFIRDCSSATNTSSHPT
jgi:hypothetical protein